MLLSSLRFPLRTFKRKIGDSDALVNTYTPGVPSLFWRPRAKKLVPTHQAFSFIFFRNLNDVEDSEFLRSEDSEFLRSENSSRLLSSLRFLLRTSKRKNWR